MFLGAILVSILTFIALTSLGYISHWAFHQRWSGRFYTSHMSHHLVLYPPSDFYSDKYRDAGKDNTSVLFFLIFLPLILGAIAITVLKIIPLLFGIIILVEMAAFGAANNVLHDAFHLRKTFWQRFWFFDKLVKLHIQHHKNMKKNFGILFFWPDKLFNTFKDGK
jgi:sterol desaturase/sphingolipid hydroxylase (fatty acid hydroxylase superfamily)